MRDDVLDVTADAADLGKPTGQDVEMDRPSVLQVTSLSPDEIDDRAREESELALGRARRRRPTGDRGD